MSSDRTVKLSEKLERMTLSMQLSEKMLINITYTLKLHNKNLFIYVVTITLQNQHCHPRWLMTEFQQQFRRAGETNYFDAMMTIPLAASWRRVLFNKSMKDKVEFQ